MTMRKAIISVVLVAIMVLTVVNFVVVPASRATTAAQSHRERVTEALAPADVQGSEQSDVQLKIGTECPKWVESPPHWEDGVYNWDRDQCVYEHHPQDLLIVVKISPFDKDTTDVIFHLCWQRVDDKGKVYTYYEDAGGGIARPDGIVAIFAGYPDGENYFYLYTKSGENNINGKPNIINGKPIGAIKTDKVHITVKEGHSEGCYCSNVPPTPCPDASFTSIPDHLYAYDPITFDASKSASADTITAYSWMIDGKSAGDTKVIKYDHASLGKHTVELTVTHKDGCTSKKSQEIVVGDKWAVVVGISKYDPKEQDPLIYPVDDALYFQDVLVSRCKFDDTHVQFLRDGEATKEGIRSALNDLRTRSGPNDLVVTYLNGHGDIRIDKDKKDAHLWFFLPSDVTGGHDATTVPTNAILSTEFSQWIDAVPSRDTLCVFDHCYSGGMHTAALTKPKYVTLASCGAYETTREFKDIAEKHGLFMYYLGEAFNTKAADTNPDKWISAEEALNYAKPKVSAKAQEYSGKTFDMTPELFDHSTGTELDLAYIGGDGGGANVFAHQTAAAAPMPGIAPAQAQVLSTTPALGVVFAPIGVGVVAYGVSMSRRR